MCVRERERERENLNSKTVILEDSSVRSTLNLSYSRSLLYYQERERESANILHKEKKKPKIGSLMKMT